MTVAPLTVFGVRHHGPGCARALLAALDALDPDMLLIEGPPDAQDVLPLAAHAAMQPPVALLVYAPERPSHAAFFPFVHYSPEWQALRFALQRGIPAAFMDLPQAVQFAAQPDGEDEGGSGAAPEVDAASGESAAAAEQTEPAPPIQDDPIGALAEAAGYADHELWWEHQIETRQNPRDLFAAIMEAMAALRAAAPAPEGVEAQREASMRQAVRAAQRAGQRRIAVVCGAWHAPAIAALGPAAADAALLAGLPRCKTAAAWVPWTNSRLAARSGYGAGVEAPGWYAHLWESTERIAIRWIGKAARLLRAEDQDASPASVVEAVRLAETLAALRERPEPGLAELTEAIQTVLCGGEALPLQLITEKLTIGEALGSVPDEAPTTPLQQDVAAEQKRLRLPPSVERKVLDLDLREETGRARSQLLHRLGALAIPWGRLQPVRGKAGGFHELWELQWQPEFALALIEANVWGNDAATAAAARLRQLSDQATELPALTTLLNVALLADLPTAITALLARVQERAAQASDVGALLDTLPPLAQIARYGDVRGTAAAQVLPVLEGLLARALIGLPSAARGLAADAAQALAAAMGRANDSIALLDRADWRADWQQALRALLGRDGAHALLRGWATRLLHEQSALGADELERLASLALSAAVPAPEAAAWLEGVLRGSGLLLLHADGLWLALDGWLRAQSAASFTEQLPLLRRAFAGFQPAERRAMGEQALRLGSQAGPRASDAAAFTALDRARADRVLPVLAQILGVTSDAG